jgi:nucleotide-binding universal stress UspA family protein
MLKRIVVPIDGSACSELALEYALGLAKARGASIYVFTLVDPIEILGRNLPSPLEEEHVAAAEAWADRIVQEAMAKAAAEGISAEGRVDVGEPAAAIVAEAMSTKADAIVMGTHGRSGFKRLFMGSVAEEVLRSSRCPVVIVRERARTGQREPAAPPINSNEPVSVLRLIEVSPDNFERLYGEIATFMNGPGAELPGLVETQLFGSVDATRIVILTRFRSHREWVRAQWDARLGELLEEIEVNAETLEFNIYHGDRFPGDALAGRQAP